MRSRDFPSYRLRHAIRVRRLRRKYPWRFNEEPVPQDDIVRLPPSDDVYRASKRRDEH